MKRTSPIIQHACAVVLILTSIVMVAYQIFTIADVADGLLMYVAQAFLLAGSIFGLDYYVILINKKLSDAIKTNTGTEKQQPPKHKNRQ